MSENEWKWVKMSENENESENESENEWKWNESEHELKWKNDLKIGNLLKFIMRLKIKNCLFYFCFYEIPKLEKTVSLEKNS